MFWSAVFGLSVAKKPVVKSINELTQNSVAKIVSNTCEMFVANLVARSQWVRN